MFLALIRNDLFTFWKQPAPWKGYCFTKRFRMLFTYSKHPTFWKFRFVFCITKIQVSQLNVQRKSASCQVLFTSLSLIALWLSIKKEILYFLCFSLSLFHEEHKFSNIPISLVYVILVPLLNSLNSWGNLIYIF